ncbi:hypothetical protein B0J14DRAFT_466208 [Halenospora varia]|nr:hypothetical protein B0J14DRAFT_466208 [Halenospora varia]
MSSSTRYSQQPLQIFQDPVTSFDHAPMPSSKNTSNLKKPSPLRPIKNAASRRNIVLNPPQSGPSKQSPLKSAQQTSSSPSRAPFGNKLNLIPMPPPGGPRYNTDSMEKKQPSLAKFKTSQSSGPQKALFTTFSTSSITEKENCPQQPYYQAPPAFGDQFSASNFSLEGLYSQKPPQKRLMEAAPIHESRALKRSRMGDNQDGREKQEPNDDLPHPDSFPALHDDGTKPSHSYAQLIGMSILRAPNRRLTLAQIYKWISDTYSFYSATDAGWQNSIRHNLSLNKAFVKQERPKDDPGKGNYWAIQPGMEAQFIKDKTRKPAGPIESGPILTAHPTPAPPQLPQMEAPPTRTFKPLIPAVQQQDLPPPPSYSQSEPQLPAIPELSSDATIPASDSFPDAEAEDRSEEAPPSSPLMHSSPPAAVMHSSPPIPRQTSRRHNTPPPVPRFPSSSINRSHKRKFASMDDTDRPRIRRGRAEEEIARLRGSSYDSPTKARTCFLPPSSSPVRKSVKNKASQMLPPLTPAVKLRAPMRPPPSVSPNTNLKLHREKVREMVGSPLRGVTSLDDNLPWSPAFNLEDTSYLFQEFTSSNELDIFCDSTSTFLTVPGNGSPEKRSAKRPCLARSRSANILADISNTNYNKNITSTPSLKLTPSLNASIFDSPDKTFGFMDSPSKLLNLSSPSKGASPAFNLEHFGLPADDFFAVGDEFLADGFDDFSGVDIMQGFQKIGSGNGTSSSKNTPKPSSRPAFGRSFTSRF